MHRDLTIIEGRDMWGNLFKIGDGGRVGRTVIDNDYFKVVVRGEIGDTVETFAEIVKVVTSGDNDSYQR